MLLSAGPDHADAAARPALGVGVAYRHQTSAVSTTAEPAVTMDASAVVLLPAPNSAGVFGADSSTASTVRKREKKKEGREGTANHGAPIEARFVDGFQVRA
ncbi:hypothetical protein COEREDRAFT_6632 [Coemansia reversa NRRL 1564]|nr:hypothetical protein COEREDRAFT_12702 [Coemansia reversa NRRL 1564]PIA18399.1 hypothetical protein COEREDRAFT_6632 [Coemansia reversa NRRL 1564]|eukprot:PIA12504.1 hypothetical protein COEREDRAFT_12702 [Coemansia reversa NRRL 1564]